MMFYLFIGFLEEIVSGESRSNTYNVLCETDSCNPDTFYQIFYSKYRVWKSWMVDGQTGLDIKL